MTTFSKNKNLLFKIVCIVYACIHLIKSDAILIPESNFIYNATQTELCIPKIQSNFSSLLKINNPASEKSDYSNEYKNRTSGYMFLLNSYNNKISIQLKSLRNILLSNYIVFFSICKKNIWRMYSDKEAPLIV